LHVHYVWELEILPWHLPEIVVVYLADGHVSNLVNVVICQVVDLPNLAGHLSELLGRHQEVWLTTGHKLAIRVKWLLSTALGMVDNVLDALMKFLA
jgi:hypothetical protein